MAIKNFLLTANKSRCLGFEVILDYHCSWKNEYTVRNEEEGYYTSTRTSVIDSIVESSLSQEDRAINMIVPHGQRDSPDDQNDSSGEVKSAGSRTSE